jgi:hypothetical protein
VVGRGRFAAVSDTVWRVRAYNCCSVWPFPHPSRTFSPHFCKRIPITQKADDLQATLHTEDHFLSRQGHKARPTANSRTGLVSKPCALKRYCCPYRGVGKGKCDHYQHETKHRYRHHNFVAPSHFAECPIAPTTKGRELTRIGKAARCKTKVGLNSKTYIGRFSPSPFLRKNSPHPKM